MYSGERDRLQLVVYKGSLIVNNQFRTHHLRNVPADLGLNSKVTLQEAYRGGPPHAVLAYLTCNPPPRPLTLANINTVETLQHDSPYMGWSLHPA